MDAIKVTPISKMRLSYRSDNVPIGHWNKAPKIVIISINIEILKVSNPFATA